MPEEITHELGELVPKIHRFKFSILGNPFEIPISEITIRQFLTIANDAKVFEKEAPHEKNVARHRAALILFFENIASIPADDKKKLKEGLEKCPPESLFALINTIIKPFLTRSTDSPLDEQAKQNAGTDLPTDQNTN